MQLQIQFNIVFIIKYHYVSYLWIKIGAKFQVLIQINQ